jgi:hypothetical protein
MRGPAWNDDAPIDLHRIGLNSERTLRDLAASAPARTTPTLELVREWQRRVYAGCAVPSASYLGNFRGDASHVSLVDYEVAVGPMQPDGFYDREGVWASNVAAELNVFIHRLADAVEVMDRLVGPDERPTSVDVLRELVALIAMVHGEWVRVHPFANGNGRTARLWAAFLALRYGLPAFVHIKPRPDDVAYARAARASMGRSPDFVGDHREAIAVFAHLLVLSLLP